MARRLIELGADLEAEGDLGRTPLAVAMLHSDLQAMRLHSVMQVYASVLMG